MKAKTSRGPYSDFDIGDESRFVISDEKERNGTYSKLLKMQMLKCPAGKIQGWFLLLPFLEDHLVNT